MSADEFDEPRNRNPRIAIDYKRVLFTALRFWYVVVASFLLAIVLAILINRYTTRIYPVTAAIIIREPAENTDARFLFNNPLVNAYRNYLNEPYIIRSYPLVQSVIESLNFQVSIVKEGTIKTSEQYTLPVDIELFSKNRYGQLTLEIIDEQSFRCYASDTPDDNVYRFGQQVSCGDFSFIVKLAGNVKSYVGGRYTINIRNPEHAAGEYINKLKVTWAMQGSSVVNLDINGPIPQKEIDFLQALIRHYQQYDLEKKSQAASRSLIFIEKQLQDMGDSLRLYENALENFKQKNFVTDLSAEAAQLYEQLKTLNDQRTLVVFASNYYNYLDKYLQPGTNYAQVILPSSIGIDDPILNTLVSQLVTLNSEYNLISRDPNTKNYLVEERKEVLRQSIEQTRLQLVEAVATLRSTDRIKSTGIAQQIRQIEDQLKALPVAQRRLVNIQRNYAFSETMYNFLQQKKAEAGISKASTTSDIVIVNPPRQSGGPITPKVTQNLLLFGLIGILLPMIVFVLMEVFNTKIQSREDIEKVTVIPFIGGIGHNRDKGNLVVHEKPKSVLAESFRALRSNLNFFTEGKDKKVFMITSSLSGEGKSFTTINLATVFAMAGKRTLIIGADLRKPKLFDDFGLDNTKGLSIYLSGLESLESIIQKTPIQDLDIISGGPVPPNPSELLLGKRMDELIAKLKEEYDFILIDTPPLALITDGLVLSKYADHAVFIVRQNYTPRDILRAANELYVSGKLKNLSLVLNDVYRTGPGYGYGSYGYGYGYSYGYGYGYYRQRKDKDTGYYAE